MKVGFDKLKIISINPSEEDLLTEFPIWEEDNFNYTYIEDNICYLYFYLRDCEYNIYRHIIKLENNPHMSYKGLIYYINQTADYQLVRDESQLFESFTNFQKGLDWDDITKKYRSYKDISSKEYRVALIGEIELLSLLSSFKNYIKYDENTNYFINTSKLFKGDFSEIKQLFRSDFPFHIVGLFKIIKGSSEILHNRFLNHGVFNDICNNMNISKYNIQQYKLFLSSLEPSDKNIFYLLMKYKEFNIGLLPKVKVINNYEPEY